MNAETTYKFHTDPGHGWLEVPQVDLDALGVTDQVSEYSYFRNGQVFLEEDCDATYFGKAFEERFGCWPRHTEIYLEVTPIRQFEKFRKVLSRS